MRSSRAVTTATRTDPPYVSPELISGLTSRLGADFTLLDWDCDHMVPQALPQQTAELLRDRLAGS